MLSLVLPLLGLLYTVSAGLEPFGYARDVTGGGNQRRVIPKNNQELINYLTDPFPRVIVLRKDFDFRNTEGVTRNEWGCIATSRCPRGGFGQTAINLGGWCNGHEYVTLPGYSNSGKNPIWVNSDKTLIGNNNGGRAMILGKGLYIRNKRNVIIRNVHFKDINPHVVFAGDAVQILGSDLVWIVDCKFTWIGRHFISVQDVSRRVTISHNEFDGSTLWSATCNHQHYWALFFVAQESQITFAYNWVHNTSGRGPKVAGNTNLHVYRNTFENIDGHAFEMSENAKVFVESTTFKNVKRSKSSDSGTWNWFSCDGHGGAARNHLGRDCVPNYYENSLQMGQNNEWILDSFRNQRLE